MRRQDAVEVAHCIAHLLKARTLVQYLEANILDVYVPDEVNLRVVMGDGDMVTVAIPPHVLRAVVTSGMLLQAAKIVAKAHERQLRDIAGITVEEE